jgi:hypothetical protein
MGEGNENLIYPSPWHFKRYFTCRKILHVTSNPKKGVLRIFIDLKNPSPWSGSNPRTLDPVVSTLTTTSLRRLKCVNYDYINRCLRSILGIWWPNMISNEDLWKTTKQNEIWKEIRHGE